MSDQPGIPAITVFPPFNPTQRQAEPAPEPVRDQAPTVSEPEAAHEEEPQPQAPAWDAAAPATPMPWDFEAPTPDEQPAAADEPAAVGDEEDDLPWLEVPTAPEGQAGEEIKADDAPNWMDWVRTEDQAPPADEGATPIEELADDAQPWAPEVETAADAWQQPVDAWKAPEAEGGDEPWQAPAPVGEEVSREPDFHLTQPAEPEAEFDLPEPELYDLPDVAPSSAAEAEAEPAWELPAADVHAGSDTPPAWESFGGAGPAATEEPAWAAPEAVNEPTPAAQPAAASTGAAGAFAEVADRLQAIADALRSDPAGFMAGAQGGGDPLGLLVAGFVLGYNARHGGGS